MAGKRSKYAPVSNAVVTLNNVTIVEPTAFRQNVRQLAHSVSLQELNALEVELRSQPGSGMTVTIVQGDRCEGNTPPVANAGADQTVVASQQVHLDGSASSDADGDALQFHWKFVNRPIGSTGVKGVRS